MSLLEKFETRIQLLALVAVIEYGSPQVLHLVARDDFYFAVCATINLVTLLALMFFRSTVLTLDIFKLIFLQMIFQFAGWALYVLYRPAALYNWSIHIVVAVTYIRILIVRKHDGDHQDNSGRLLLHRFADGCKAAISKVST
jgi:hypothetical protein